MNDSNLSAKTDTTTSSVHANSNVPKRMSLADIIKLGAAVRQSNQLKQHLSSLRKQPQKVKRSRLLYTDSDSTPSHVRKRRKSAVLGQDKEDTNDCKTSLAERIKAKRQEIGYLDQSKSETPCLKEKENEASESKYSDDKKDNINVNDDMTSSTSNIDKCRGNENVEKETKEQRKNQEYRNVTSLDGKEKQEGNIRTNAPTFSTKEGSHPRSGKIESSSNNKHKNNINTKETMTSDLHILDNSENRKNDEEATHWKCKRNTSEKTDLNGNYSKEIKLEQKEFVQLIPIVNDYDGSQLIDKRRKTKSANEFEAFRKTEVVNKNEEVKSNDTDIDRNTELMNTKNYKSNKTEIERKREIVNSADVESDETEIERNTEQVNKEHVKSDKNENIRNTELVNTKHDKTDKAEIVSKTELVYTKDVKLDEADLKTILMNTKDVKLDEADMKTELINTKDDKTDEADMKTELIDTKDDKTDEAEIERKIELMATKDVGSDKIEVEKKTKLLQTEDVDTKNVKSDKTEVKRKTKLVQTEDVESDKNEIDRKTKLVNIKNNTMDEAEIVRKNELMATKDVGSDKIEVEKKTKLLQTEDVESDKNEIDRETKLVNTKKNKTDEADIVRKNELVDTKDVESDETEIECKTERVNIKVFESDGTEIERNTELVNKERVESDEKENNENTELVNTKHDKTDKAKIVWKTELANTEDINQDEIEIKKKFDLVNTKDNILGNINVDRETKVVDTYNDKTDIGRKLLLAKTKHVKSDKTELNLSTELGELKELIKTKEDLKSDVPEINVGANFVNSEDNKSDEAETEKKDKASDYEQSVKNEKSCNDEISNRQTVAKHEKHTISWKDFSKQGEINNDNSNKEFETEDTIKNVVEKSNEKITKASNESKATEPPTQHGEPVNKNIPTSTNNMSSKTDRCIERKEKYGERKSGTDKDMKPLLLSLRNDIDQEQTLSEGLIEEFRDFHDSPLVRFSKAILEVRFLSAIDIPEKGRKRTGSFRSEGHVSDSSAKCISSNSFLKNSRITLSDSEIQSKQENTVNMSYDIEAVQNSESIPEQTVTITNNSEDIHPEKEDEMNIDKETVTQECDAKTNQDCKMNNVTYTNAINSNQQTEVDQKSENPDTDNVFPKADMKQERIASSSENVDNQTLIAVTNNETSSPYVKSSEMKPLNDEINVQEKHKHDEATKVSSVEYAQINKSKTRNIDNFDSEIKICKTYEHINGLEVDNDKKFIDESTEKKIEIKQIVCLPQTSAVTNKQKYELTKDNSSNEKRLEFRKRKTNKKTDKSRIQKLQTQDSKTNVRFKDRSVEEKLEKEHEIVSHEKNENNENLIEENCDTMDESKAEVYEDVTCQLLKSNKGSDLNSTEKLSLNKSISNFIYPSGIPKTPSLFNLREFKQASVNERKRTDHNYTALPVTPNGQLRRNSGFSDPIKAHNFGQSTNGILKSGRHSSALSHVSEKESISTDFMQDKHLSMYSRMQNRKPRRRKGSSSIAFKKLDVPNSYCMHMNLQEHYLEDTYEYMRIERLNKEAFDMSDDNVSTDGLKLPPLSGIQHTKTDGLQSLPQDAKDRSFFYITPLHSRDLSFTEINKTLSRVDEILLELSLYKQCNEKQKENKHGVFDCRSTLTLTCNEENQMKLSIDHPRIIYDNTRDRFRTSKTFEESSQFCLKNGDLMTTSGNQKSKALKVLKRKLKMKHQVIC